MTPEGDLLLSSESVYRIAFDALNEGIVIQDRDGGIVACNASAERILALSLADMRGLTSLDPRWKAVDEQGADLPGDRHPASITRTTGEPCTGVLMGFHNGSGHLVWAEVTSRSLLGKDQQTPIGVVCTFQDVTVRQQVKSERDHFFLMSLDMLCIVGFDGRFRQLNPAWSATLGYSLEELRGRPFLDFVHADDVERTMQETADLIGGDSTVYFENRYRTADGSYRWLLWSSSASVQDQLFYAVARDITERKLSEQRVEKMGRHTQLLLDCVGDGLFGIDCEGRITFANPAAAALTGHPPARWRGQDLHTLIHHSRPDGSPFPTAECPLLVLFLRGTGPSPIKDIVWRADGSFFEAEFISSAVIEDGVLEGAVVTFRDISERQAIERIKDEFISVVSHELRTPLTSMRGSLGLLAGGVLGPLPERGQRMLDMAVSNTDRLIRLINDILDLERISSGKVALHRAWTSVAHITSAVLGIVSPLADAARIELILTGEDETLWVDTDRMVQALTNMVSNAIKFSPPETTVSLSSELSGERIVFRVEDHGRGIPEDMLTRIFERFEQVDASDARVKGGTGLGLAICRAIVLQHGGRIWVESTVGEGSTFYLAVPRPPRPVE